MYIGVYGWVYVWVYGFDLQASETEKDGFGTDALKYIEEVTKALGNTT